MKVTDEMVNRFLCWKLPEHFSPDCGISFVRDYNQHTPYPAKHEPVGTNLFTADQAREMLEHVLDGDLNAPPDEAREILAGRLIDAWCADKGRQIPWAKAIQIVAIVTKQSDEERDRLLRMGDEDGSCEMCGRSDAAASKGADHEQ